MLDPETVSEALGSRVRVDQIDERADAANKTFRAYVDTLAARFEAEQQGRVEDEMGQVERRAGEIPLQPDLLLEVESYGELRQLTFVALVEVEVDGEPQAAIEKVSFSSGLTGLRVSTTAFTETDGLPKEVTLAEYTAGGFFSPVSTNGLGKVEAFERLLEKSPVE